jgi:hypothetical protein
MSSVTGVPTTGVLDKLANNLYIKKKLKVKFSYCFLDGLFYNYSNLGTLAKHLSGNCGLGLIRKKNLLNTLAFGKE